MQKKVDELNLVARLSEIVFGDGFCIMGFGPRDYQKYLLLARLVKHKQIL
jgi:hypothetical protein